MGKITACSTVCTKVLFAHAFELHTRNSGSGVARVWSSRAASMNGDADDEKQDHLMMILAPDRTIILGVPTDRF